MPKRFVEGSTVKLKTGGPLMAVDRLGAFRYDERVLESVFERNVYEFEIAYCTWFDEHNELQGGYYPIQDLILI